MRKGTIYKKFIQIINFSTGLTNFLLQRQVFCQRNIQNTCGRACQFVNSNLLSLTPLQNSAHGAVLIECREIKAS